MRDPRREFLAGIAGAGMSGLLAARLAADDKKDGGGAGQDPRKKPSMSMVVETMDAGGKGGLPECLEVKPPVFWPSVVSAGRRGAESCTGRSSPVAFCIADRLGLIVRG
jgi:hypothetical protein